MRRNIFSYVQEQYALEEVPIEVANGKAVIEKEYVLYARIASMKTLEGAAYYESQEQWEIKIPKVSDNASAGRIRIRKTTNESGGVRYIQTTKVKVDEGEEELPLEVTEEAFNQFKKLATSGMVKKRYCFPIEGTDLKWEVDVFPLLNGKISAWCKIDLEYKNELSTMPKLPIGFTDVIYNQKNEQTDDEKRKIQNLYSTVFLRKNEYRK